MAALVVVLTATRATVRLLPTIDLPLDFRSHVWPEWVVTSLTPPYYRVRGNAEDTPPHDAP